MISKKGAIYAEKPITLIILIVFLVIFLSVFLSPEGFLQSTIGQANKFKTMIPGVGGLDKKPALTPTEEIQDSFDSLIFALTEAQKLDDLNCIIYYKELPELNDWTLEILKAENAMNIRIKNPAEQVVATKNIPGLVPCITAGKEGERNAGKNFFLTHLSKELGVYDVWVRGVELTGDQKEFTEHKNMVVGEWTTGSDEYLLTEGVYYDLEDADLKYKTEEISLLYKADKQHICFIPTNEAANYNDEGIDDNYLKEFLPEGKYPIRLCHQT